MRKSPFSIQTSITPYEQNSMLSDHRDKTSQCAWEIIRQKNLAKRMLSSTQLTMKRRCIAVAEEHFLSRALILVCTISPIAIFSLQTELAERQQSQAYAAGLFRGEMYLQRMWVVSSVSLEVDCANGTSSHGDFSNWDSLGRCAIRK